jgi:hypothetical protein
MLQAVRMKLVSHECFTSAFAGALVAASRRARACFVHGPGRGHARAIGGAPVSVSTYLKECTTVVNIGSMSRLSYISQLAFKPVGISSGPTLELLPPPNLVASTARFAPAYRPV